MCCEAPLRLCFEFATDLIIPKLGSHVLSFQVLRLICLLCSFPRNRLITLENRLFPLLKSKSILKLTVSVVALKMLHTIFNTYHN